MLTGWMILMLAGEADTVMGVAVNTCWAERGVTLCGELLAGVTRRVGGVADRLAVSGVTLNTRPGTGFTEKLLTRPAVRGELESVPTPRPAVSGDSGAVRRGPPPPLPAAPAERSRTPLSVPPLSASRMEGTRTLRPVCPCPAFRSLRTADWKLFTTLKS